MAKVYVGVGHGGSDPGAVSGSHKEKVYALDIATACTAELKRHGVSVMQSRTCDVAESAAAKVKECNSYNPDLAIDIHLNAGKGDGFEVYRSIVGGKGVVLAEAIEKAVKAIGQNSRGIKTKKNDNNRDYFAMIRQTNCIAVLVECAFIDSKDVDVIDTLVEREVMGIAIAHGILKYLGIAVKVQASSGASKLATVNVSVPVLEKGMKGESVRALQRLLIGRGQSCGSAGADGDFGSGTQTAVKAFQTASKLTVTGKADGNTWAKLLG